MKKINIICCAALLMGFASCDDKSDLGKMQVNEQLPIMSAEGVKTEYGAALQGSTLNLNDYLNLAAIETSVTGTPKNEMIPLYSLVEAEGLPEGATVTFSVQVANNENYADADEMALTDGALLASELERVFQNFYKKDPRAQEMWVRFAAFVKDGSQTSRVGTPDTWYGAKKVTVTPVDFELGVQNSYKFQAYVDGVAQDPVVMGHSSEHPYNDPSFSTTVSVTNDDIAAGYTWDIVAEDGTVYYPDASGMLAEEGVKGEITESGNYRLVVNMLDMTYELGLAYEKLTTPGNANGWDPASEHWCLTTSDYNNYYGYVWIDGDFKFATGSWALDWGKGSAEGTLARGGANINPAEGAGLYYVTLSLGDLTYKLVKIESIGCIGYMNGWGAQVPLTISDNGQTIKGEVTFTEPDNDNGWKFRANDDWDINLGSHDGDENDLVPNGGNLLYPGVGTYEVTLNLYSMPYTFTATKK